MVFVHLWAQGSLLAIQVLPCSQKPVLVSGGPAGAAHSLGKGKGPGGAGRGWVTRRPGERHCWAQGPP